jgi:hypothetical protein
MPMEMCIQHFVGQKTRPLNVRISNAFFRHALYIPKKSTAAITPSPIKTNNTPRFSK